MLGIFVDILDKLRVCTDDRDGSLAEVDILVGSIVLVTEGLRKALSKLGF